MFTLESSYQPQGDQPEAIKQLVDGVLSNQAYQTLLGVTGSGKTYTIANVIKEVEKPTLVLTHNKTLVAQLYGEFKNFFPENAVEYFVSYYDYYQPEAYLPSTNVYIEKDLSINAELEKLRLRTTSSLLSGRRDIIVVASVSCIYGIGNPTEYANGVIRLSVGKNFGRNNLLHKLVNALYNRNNIEFERGMFRVKGDTVDVNLPYADHGLRIIFFGDEIEDLHEIEISTGKKIKSVMDTAIFPANMYLAPQDQMKNIVHEIQDEMIAQEAYFKQQERYIEAQRIKERVEYDLEMIQELGYCKGIENYSRFLDRRQPGERPFCLIDYFPEDYLLVLDESHVTLPQISGMFGGDRARKLNLVNYGFRLPSALDNRPLNFQEFQSKINQVIFVSATPGNFELEKCEGIVVDQVVRPTGLLDPPIEVRPTINQVDDLLDEIDERVNRNERVLVTTLTKRLSEELAKYMLKLNIKCKYLHSEIDALERIEILRDLRLGHIDVLIGVNLLREGLDLPEVSLVAILDADKEGFLRDTRSLTQTAGRAARNVNGFVIFYADKITKSMQLTMDETARRREKQIQYNTQHKVTPKSISKSIDQIMKQTSVLEIKGYDTKSALAIKDTTPIAAEEEMTYKTLKDIEKEIASVKKQMEKAAKDLDFMEAARLRDVMMQLKAKL
ncbi:MAG: excinuclease ABC subunit UvrB [Chitinophagaceae bacterium]